MKHVKTRLSGLLCGAVVAVVALVAVAGASTGFFGGIGAAVDPARSLNFETNMSTVFTPTVPARGPLTMSSFRAAETINLRPDGSLEVTIHVTGRTRSSVMAARLSYDIDLDGDGQSSGPLESDLVLAVATFDNGGVKFRPIHKRDGIVPALDPIESSANPPPPGEPNEHAAVSRLPVATVSGIVPAAACAVRILVLDRDLRSTLAAVSVP